MRRYTTPTHYFTLQIDPSTIQKIRITYSQNNKVVLQKSNDEITLENKVAKVKLSQNETALFDANNEIEMQVRVLTYGGDALASEIMKDSAERVLDDEVI